MCPNFGGCPRIAHHVCGIEDHRLFAKMDGLCVFLFLLCATKEFPQAKAQLNFLVKIYLINTHIFFIMIFFSRFELV